MGILSADPSELIVLTACGVIAGLLAFVVTAATLVGNNWLEGVLLNATGVLGVFVACALPTVLSVSLPPSAMSFVASLPAVCCIACFPLLVMRWWFGWRLTNSLATIRRPPSLSIEDLILVPSAVVAMVVAANVTSAFLKASWIPQPAGTCSGPFRSPFYVWSLFCR